MFLFKVFEETAKKVSYRVIYFGSSSVHSMWVNSRFVRENRQMANKKLYSEDVIRRFWLWRGIFALYYEPCSYLKSESIFERESNAKVM